MKRRDLKCLVTALLVGNVLASPPAILAAEGAGGVVDDSNWERLRSMSLDQRQFLAAKLKEFDVLPREEQVSIRKLDDELQKLPRQNREEAYSVIRRYHLWLSSLSEADRNELNNLPPDKKMERIRVLREGQPPASSDYPSDLHPSVFGSNSPYDLANQIKTWLSLTPDRKTSLMNMKESDRGRKLNEFRQEMKIVPVARPIPSASDEQFAAERWKAFRNQANIPALKKFDDPDNKEFQEKKTRRLRRVAEARAFEGRTVEKVRTDRLLEFASQMPPWIRALFDGLSPELARQQLTLLYRLVFPAPTEISPAKPAGVGKPATKGTSIKKDAAPASKDAKPPDNSQPF